MIFNLKCNIIVILNGYLISIWMLWKTGNYQVTACKITFYVLLCLKSKKAKPFHVMLQEDFSVFSPSTVHF